GEAGRGLEEEEGPEAHGSGDYSAIAPASALTPPGGACSMRGGGADGDPSRRDRGAHLSSLDLPARGGPERLDLQSVPGRRGGAALVPLRPARAVPRGVEGGGARHGSPPAALDHVQSPRPPRALANDEVLDLGGRRVRRLDTPHVPHCWDAGLLYEETTGTLFTSDLFT